MKHITPNYLIYLKKYEKKSGDDQTHLQNMKIDEKRDVEFFMNFLIGGYQNIYEYRPIPYWFNLTNNKKILKKPK